MRVVGWNDSIAIYIASSESCKPKRFVCCWNKVEKRYIEEEQPNQFHHYNQNMGSVNRMDQNVAKYWNRNESGARVFLLIKLQVCQGLCFNKVANLRPATLLKKSLWQACNFIIKETLAHVFSCEFCEIFKNIFSTGHLRWLLLYHVLTPSKLKIKHCRHLKLVKKIEKNPHDLTSAKPKCPDRRNQQNI